VLLAASASAAAAPPSADLDVRLGFGGAVRVGVPVPVDVWVPPLPSAGPAELVVGAPALGPQAGTVVASTVVRFDAVPGAARAFHLPVVLSDVRRPLVVRVLVGGREVRRRGVAIPPASVGGRIVAVLSRTPVSLAALHRLPGRVVVAPVEPEALPRAFQEYAGVDLVVVRDTDPARIDDAQREALLTWVRLGGRLLLIPRPGGAPPAFLAPVLPAAVGDARMVSFPGGLLAGYGGGLGPGPYAASVLAPRPGGDVVRAGDVPIVAAGAAGAGRVTVWAIDFEAPAFAAWPGRLRLWEEALGPPRRPFVDVGAAAAQLPQSTPLDPVVHAEAGAAIALYILSVLAIGRRYPSVLGVVAGIALACGGAGAFALLARDARARATGLAQLTVLEQAPATGLARAVTVAAVAVPYGGPFRVRAPRGMVAAQVAPAGDLRVELHDGGSILSGRLRPGEGARGLYAIGAVPLHASGRLSDDGRTLTVDLGRARLRRAEIRWADRAYPLGDLPPGISTLHLAPDTWKKLADADDAWAWLFRATDRDDIVKAGTPLLVGEAEPVGPALLLADRGARGARRAILLVPLSR